MKLEFSSRIIKKSSNIKRHENQSSGSVKSEAPQASQSRQKQFQK
jgi:hypothetical protein